MNTHPKNTIRDYILIRMYKTMKANPNKIFTSSELSHKSLTRQRRRRYFDILITLDCIEEVTSYYYNAKKNIRRRIAGFRLK